MFRRVGRFLHGVTCWAAFLAASGLNILLGLVVQALAAPFDRDRRAALAVNHALWGTLLWWIEPFWHRRIEGLDRLPPGPAVFVANHSSVLDIPAAMGLPRPLRVVGKAALLKVPVMGAYMRFSRQIALDSSSPASIRDSLDRALASLRRGISLLIFPEGTRSVDGRLQPFHRGAFRIAKDAGVPVVPVSITGTGPIMPKGILWPRPSREPVRVVVHPPVDPERFSTARALGNHVHRVLQAALEEQQGAGHAA